MRMANRMDVDGYMARLSTGTVPHLVMARSLSLAAAPGQAKTELPTTGPGW